MFKAVENLKEQKGFTLIELLIVIAIIGILAAIAIPAFLGQREKAKIRSVEASCKGAISEVQGVLDSFVTGEAFILLDTAGIETCYEQNESATSRKCAAMFSGVQVTSYNASPFATGIVLVRDYIIDHHNGKGEMSAYVGSEPLFISTDLGAQVDASGQCGLANATTRSFTIKGYASSTNIGDEIVDATVSAR